jgi:hypothetical protein
MRIRNGIAFGAALLLLSLGTASIAKAGEGGPRVCDARADDALDVEDYPEALLGGQREVVLGETAAAVLPPAAAFRATEDQPKPSSPIDEPELAMFSHR